MYIVERRVILESIKLTLISNIVQEAILNKTSIKLINSEMIEIRGISFSRFPLKYYIMYQ